MPRLSLIVAMAKNRVIGANNKIPWHLPNELKLFKSLTMGHHIVMGRKTYESIGRLLPGRTTVIVTRQKDYAVPGAIVAHSIADAIAACEGDDEVFVIGGADLFRETLPVADRLYLTTVDAKPAGDTFMPEFDAGQWKETSAQAFEKDEKHAYAYRLAVLDRVKPPPPRTLPLKGRASCPSRGAVLANRLLRPHAVGLRQRETVLSHQSRPAGVLRGMLTLDELREHVATGDIETIVVGFTDHYGRLLGKRFDAEMFLEDIVEGEAHACDYLLAVDMDMNPVPGYSFASWELGYGDFSLVPDFKTLRTASWLNHSAFVLCDLKNEKTHEYISVAPRSILRRQLEAAKALGYDAFAASELEHYVFRKTYREAQAQGYRDLSPAGWYREDYHMLQAARTEDYHSAVRRHLKYSGVPVENSKGEWGVGQHEVNVRYAEALEMADRHVVFKQCMKELADTMGCSVTFMAKPAADQPGSSCHIHFSLWRDGKNAFPGKHKLGPLECSDAFRWFLGGWMAHLPDVMVFYAPTINSYKRYVDGSWAPTRIAWSHDNRTAGFRVVGSDKGLRIECRIPGADCNPYLGFAAALASGLDGIRNKIDPPEHFSGDVYSANNLPRVPYTLGEAADAFEKSAFAKEAFGADVVEHYLHFFRTEQHAYNFAVTDWERQRYFEQI